MLDSARVTSFRGGVSLARPSGRATVTPGEGTPMTARTLVVRWATRAGTASVTAVIAAAGLTGTAGAQAATPAANGAARPPAVNPLSPASGHSYRHGVLPTIGQQRRMNRWATRHAISPAASALNLSYGGGVHGVGVTTGHEKVYLVFWGSQWGASSTGQPRQRHAGQRPERCRPVPARAVQGPGYRWRALVRSDDPVLRRGPVQLAFLSAEFLARRVPDRRRAGWRLGRQLDAQPLTRRPAISLAQKRSGPPSTSATRRKRPTGTRSTRSSRRPEPIPTASAPLVSSAPGTTTPPTRISPAAR